MDPDNPEAWQPASILVKTTLLFAALVLCQKIHKGSIVSNPFLFVSQEEPAHAQPRPYVKKKKIYLTFDDGPNKGTQKVLHIMQQEEIPVTFFIIGEHAFASIGQQQTWDSLKMAKEIELCNHSYTHAWHNHYSSYYNNPDSVIHDFSRCRDSLQLDNNVCRTPGRNTWRIDTVQYTDLKRSKAAVDSLSKAGFAIMGWDLEWHYDGKTLAIKNTADDLLRQIDSVFAHHKTKVPDHMVLLAHDQVYEDLADSSALHNLIKKLKARDEYEFELVKSYPGIKQWQ